MVDPDTVYPLFVKSTLLVPGIKGLVIATLAAAYMSTFSSEVNATASMMVRDIWEPLFRKEKEGSRGTVFSSYLAALLLVLCCMGGVKERALASSEPANQTIPMGRALFNCLAGSVAMYALYMTPVYYLGRCYPRHSS